MNSVVGIFLFRGLGTCRFSNFIQYTYMHMYNVQCYVCIYTVASSTSVLEHVDFHDPANEPVAINLKHVHVINPAILYRY